MAGKRILYKSLDALMGYGMGLQVDIGAIDGLDGTGSGYQRRCLGEMFCLIKQKDVLEKKSCHDFLKRSF
ncbi:hypothetical protein Tco_1380557 [Tanacetum coccineum]